MIKKTIFSVLTLSVAFSISAKTIEVEILKMKFIPAEVSIEKGDTVVWKNIEKRQYHSVWFKAENFPEPDYFFPGETFSRTFDQIGDYPYECGPHPDMKGLIKVKKVKVKKTPIKGQTKEK